jgi:hypothetical protein
MAKLVVDNTQIANEFFDDARLIGIQCPLEAHRFVWLINRTFGMQFHYLQESEIKMKSMKRNYEYAIYQFMEAHLELEHILYVNEDEGKHLLPELKHIDYLWLLKGNQQGTDFFQSLMTGLRQIEDVLLVMELTNEKIRHKEHLVL